MSRAPLGMIAGQGALPLRIAEAQVAAGREVFIIGVNNEADPAIETYPHHWCEIGEVKRCADVLRQAGCEEMVIIGAVQRPNLEAMQSDEGGQWVLNKVMENKQLGDDVLLSTLVSYFLTQGLSVKPAEAFLAALIGPLGQLGDVAIGPHEADVSRGLDVARAIGELDIGQCVVVGRRVTLAVEGPEGTDAMLKRVAGLSRELRGSAEARCGVLVKLPKPQQDRRVDLPTIGVQTVTLAAEAGLAGIIYEAGGVLLADMENTKAAADQAGLFLVGVEKPA
jgi:DUF1009 family protein